MATGPWFKICEPPPALLQTRNGEISFPWTFGGEDVTELCQNCFDIH